MSIQAAAAAAASILPWHLNWLFGFGTFEMISVLQLQQDYNETNVKNVAKGYSTGLGYCFNDAPSWSSQGCETKKIDQFYFQN